MTPIAALEHLSTDGFLGLRAVGSSESIWLDDRGDVVVSVGDHERVISPAQFEAQFCGATFRVPTAEEAARA